MSKKGFTLVELMVVVAIIMILSGIVVAGLSGAKVNSRDSKRVADIKSIQIALSLYYNDNLKYPKNLTQLVTGGYMSSVPKDPNTASGGKYYYVCLMTSQIACNTGSRYHLGALLEDLNNPNLADNADLARNANGYQAAADSQEASDFAGKSVDCSDTLSSPDQCYDVTGN